LELGNALDKVSAYLNAPQLEPEQKVSVVDFIRSEFGSLKLEDIGGAVKAVMSGRVEPTSDISRISKQSVGWYGAILKPYKTYLEAENRRNPPITPNDMNTLATHNSNEGNDQRFYDHLEQMYIRNGHKLPETYAWLKVRRHATREGILKVFKADESTCKEMARGYLSAQRVGNIDPPTKVTRNEIEKAMCQLHFDRLYTELV